MNLHRSTPHCLGSNPLEKLLSLQPQNQRPQIVPRISYNIQNSKFSKTDGNENVGEGNEDARKKEEEEHDVVSIPPDITTDSSPADLLEKATNNMWIVHTVGELIYQSVLGGFGDVAASPDPAAATD
ncbi:unnamed protein product [Sphagnum tenellum]